MRKPSGCLPIGKVRSPYRGSLCIIFSLLITDFERVSEKYILRPKARLISDDIFLFFVPVHPNRVCHSIHQNYFILAPILTKDPMKQVSCSQRDSFTVSIKVGSKGIICPHYHIQIISHFLSELHKIDDLPKRGPWDRIRFSI